MTTKTQLRSSLLRVAYPWILRRISIQVQQLPYLHPSLKAVAWEVAISIRRNEKPSKSLLEKNNTLFLVYQMMRVNWNVAILLPHGIDLVRCTRTSWRVLVASVSPWNYVTVISYSANSVRWIRIYCPSVSYNVRRRGGYV